MFPVQYFVYQKCWYRCLALLWKFLQRSKIFVEFTVRSPPRQLSLQKENLLNEVEEDMEEGLMRGRFVGNGGHCCGDGRGSC